MSAVVPPPFRSSGSPGGPRVTVVRGTYQANLPELTIYSRLREHGFQPELLGARRTSYSDDEVGMPVRRLATPWIRGALSKTVPGGFLLGKLSPYRYFHEYLLGFHRAVSQSDILFPTDLGHPTSYQAILEQPRAKVVVQAWENIPFNWPEDRPLARHYEAVLEKADFFVPLTKDADRTLALQGVPADRRAQVYPGLDLGRYRPPAPDERRRSREGLGAKEGSIVVAFVGKVEFYKGIFTLLEAMTRVPSSVRLVVVGDGRGRPRAEHRAKRLGVAGKVSFTGGVPHRDLLSRVLWGSDLLVLPSIPTDQWREQLGQVLLEAMASGLPVIGTRTGGIPEVVEPEVNGLLVAPDAPTELSSAITLAATDPASRESWGKAGRRTVESKFEAGRNSSVLASILSDRVLRRSA